MKKAKWSKYVKRTKAELHSLGRRLVEAGVITQGQLDAALREQTGDAELLGETLIRLGYVDEKQLEPFLTDEEKGFQLAPLDLGQLDSPALMEFYQLQSQIKFALFSDTPLNSILITSALSNEGKSLCSSYMAIVSAVTLGKKVLLVDADLRHPSLHRVFHVPNSRGLSDVLINSCSIEEAVQPTKLANLLILPAGTRASNPPQLLSSSTMESLLKRLGERYELVFIDSPPALVTPEAALLGALAQGTILVVQAGRSRLKELEKTVNRMQRAKANILGVLLNQYEGEELESYRYKYYSRQDKDEEE